MQNLCSTVSESRTCKPYLTYAIEECIRGAQDGGVGVVVNFRKEGRALGTPRPGTSDKGTIKAECDFQHFHFRS